MNYDGLFENRGVALPFLCFTFLCATFLFTVLLASRGDAVLGFRVVASRLSLRSYVLLGLVYPWRTWLHGSRCLHVAVSF